MTTQRVEVSLGDQKCVIETGLLAKQANGAVTVTCGGTMVLVTACMSSQPREGIDFFPLLVDYQEKTYSAGRIPGGFFKREGRPTQKEILSARLIDRPLRPLFPDGFRNDVQIVATVLSSDGMYDPDVLALVGASAALIISDIPFEQPVGGVRVADVGGRFVINPTYQQREQSALDLVVAGDPNGVFMIEGEAKEVAEDRIVAALEAAQPWIASLVEAQNQLRAAAGRPKITVSLAEPPRDLLPRLREMSLARFRDAYRIADKQEREEAVLRIYADAIADMSLYEPYQTEDQEITSKTIQELLGQIEYEEVRRMIFEEGRRADGRGVQDIRPIHCEVGVLPRTHGAALFCRGQTQSLGIVTLGTKRDEQLIESLEGTRYENFLLHYNFPPFSVGEVRPLRGPGRREIGHGALAAKALKAVLPGKEDFPYTIRVVSEILESNGSSSMASVCSGSLALMDAGVPVKAAVAGISIGLVTQGQDKCLLTDIMGLEDHFGDMDFKVAGTREGVTAVQLDLKIRGVPLSLLKEALDRAREARHKILDVMGSVLERPRGDLSPYAPRIMTTQVPVEKIGEIIGPGGRIIKKITETTGVSSIDIDEDGTVIVAADNLEAAKKAIDYINGMLEEPELGRVYEGTVKRLMNFGAFVEFLPGKEGLVHISELSDDYVKDVSDVVKVGDKIKVKLIEIDKLKRMNLSKKQAESPEAPPTVKSRPVQGGPPRSQGRSRAPRQRP